MHAYGIIRKGGNAFPDDLLYLRNGTEHLVQQRIGISIERQIRTPYIHSPALTSPQSRNLACGARLSDARTDTTEQQLLKQGRNTEVLLPRTVVHQQIKSRCFGNTYFSDKFRGTNKSRKAACNAQSRNQITYNSMPVCSANAMAESVARMRFGQTSGRDKYHFSFHIAQK